jgi:putative endonuclease
MKNKCIYKNRFGKRGELIASEYLKDKGFDLIQNNYRYDRAEIDLIFEDTDNSLLLFVEVKTRANKKFGEPEESITPLKMEQIRKAAMGFISENESFLKHDVRLDVITIMLVDDKAEINHIENAF